MARAFIDDSGTGGDSRYFVLGGYVGSLRTWGHFAEDWQTVLDTEPKIKYFKMSEAESLKGCFLGFSAAQRNARLSEMANAKRVVTCRRSA